MKQLDEVEKHLGLAKQYLKEGEKELDLRRKFLKNKEMI